MHKHLLINYETNWIRNVVCANVTEAAIFFAFFEYSVVPVDDTSRYQIYNCSVCLWMCWLMCVFVGAAIVIAAILCYVCMLECLLYIFICGKIYCVRAMNWRKNEECEVEMLRINTEFFTIIYLYCGVHEMCLLLLCLCIQLLYGTYKHNK